VRENRGEVRIVSLGYRVKCSQ